MKFNDYFIGAKYVSAPGNYFYPYIRRKFNINKKIKSATLYFSALGFAEIYLNGKKVTEDKFITPHTMYNKQIPNEFYINPGAFSDAYFNDVLGYTRYVSEFDVTELIKDGNNAFGVILSGGWYYPGCDSMYLNYRNFGRPKVCFRIAVSYTDGTFDDFESDALCKWFESFIIRGSVFEERVDERMEILDFSNPDFDDSDWYRIYLYEADHNVKYLKNTCPADKIMKYLTPTLIKETETEKVYALPENTTGYPVVKTANGKKGDLLTIRYGEEITEDNELENYHTYKQVSTCITDGREEHHVRFTWYGFQYFSVSTTGNIKDVCCDTVAVIYADVKNTSEFKCNLDAVNYYYNAYILTQQENYHCGLPCDCPQIEKRGYTGDGQLLLPLGLTTFDSVMLYRKWLNDISDVQDRETGFVHNTAPVYVSCAGGPGGWSSAIINAPYNFYKYTGDISVLERFYPQMLKFIDFIAMEREDDLVTIHYRNAHCLGDWSGPYRPYLPEKFANTCLIINTFKNFIKVAKILNKVEIIEQIEEIIGMMKEAVNRDFFDEKTGDYCENKQGANALALDAGLGDKRTLKNLKDRYAEYKGFDTGIFGTHILPKVLFENDASDVAMGLYTSDNDASFKKWMEWGETTLRESWFNTRSHNHPMFGAPVLWLFEHVLGIQQKEGSTAYKNVLINPKKIAALTDVSGSIVTPSGKFMVAYKKIDNKTEFTIEIPKNTDCEFDYDGNKFKLESGVNKFVI